MTITADPTATFRQEAAELLVLLEEALLDLETSPHDAELVGKAFRALHTIKGSGAMFGFDAVARFTHDLETAFDAVRRGTRPITPALISLTLASLDHVRALIESPADADAATGEALLASLRGIIAEPDAAPPPPAAAPAEEAADADRIWRIRFHLAENAMSYGTNPLLLLDELRQLGDCTVTALTDGVPRLAEMDPVGCYVGWDVLLTTRQPRSAIEDVFIFVADDARIAIQPLAGEDAAPKRLGDILVERGDIAPGDVEAAAGRQQKLGTLLVADGKLSPDRMVSALAEQQHVREKAKVAPELQAASVRVQADRLDGLMDLVGELVITHARLRQIAADSSDLNLRSIAEEIERLAGDLRATTMDIRMLPIGSLFGRFRRLVRDLSQSLGKPVALTTDGEETELDKTVIERLNDPLVHLIRNCVDHGIESAAARAEAGKPAEGQVHLAARHSGAEVVMVVRDDGGGLDRARIRAKAEEQGLLAPDARPTDAELLQLIFHPGFSTASRVSSVSGRGVGMDVVKRTIEALRGRIDIDSRPGEGTEVTLRLPLTLAIIDGLLVRVGQGRYVIPLAAVEECVELSAEDDTRSTGRSFLNIRGDLVPFLRLRELFHAATPPAPYQKVVVVSAAEMRVGLVVDQVIGDHQTVIKSLSRLHADVETFSGATILGDGTVALILDVAHLIEEGQRLEERLMAS